MQARRREVSVELGTGVDTLDENRVCDGVRMGNVTLWIFWSGVSRDVGGESKRMVMAGDFMGAWDELLLSLSSSSLSSIALVLPSVSLGVDIRTFPPKQ